MFTHLPSLMIEYQLREECSGESLIRSLTHNWRNNMQFKTTLSLGMADAHDHIHLPRVDLTKLDLGLMLKRTSGYPEVLVTRLSLVLHTPPTSLFFNLQFPSMKGIFFSEPPIHLDLSHQEVRIPPAITQYREKLAVKHSADVPPVGAEDSGSCTL